MAKKYLNDTGLLYFYNKLKTVFQQQESGKGLSTNDYTTTEKDKLSGIASGAEVNQNAFSNVIIGATTIAADSKTDTFTLEAGSNVTITPDATNDKVTISSTDTTYSTLTQEIADTGTETTGKLITAKILKDTISNAIAGITQFDIQVVSTLPGTGVKGIIYLLSHNHGASDVYDEYIWTGSGYEKIGNTDIDLSDYLKTTDIVAINTSEIDTLFV